MKLSDRAKNAFLFSMIVANTVAMGSCAYMVHEDAKRQCVRRWAESSTPSKVTKAGCMVENTPGNWIPEEFMKGQR